MACCNGRGRWFARQKAESSSRVLTVAQALAEDAMVFHDKRIVERGTIADLLKSPKDVRTKRLIEAVSASSSQNSPSPPL